jgi:aspartyl-tRNA(Asn)/glutamyl-tRNA(Gln) amidotransferase subunit C
MTISREEVKKIAELARLELTAEEEDRHAETMSAVLDYMKILDEVDTRSVAITSQVTGLENIIRDDQVEGCENPKEVLASFPQTRANELVVPGVFN